MEILSKHLNKGGTIYLGSCYSQWLSDYFDKHPKEFQRLFGNSKLVCVGDDGGKNGAKPVLSYKQKLVFEGITEEVSLEDLSMQHGLTIKLSEAVEQRNGKLSQKTETYALHKHPKILEYLLYLSQVQIGNNQLAETKLAEIGSYLEKHSQEKNLFGILKHPGLAKEWGGIKERIANKENNPDDRIFNPDFLRAAVRESFLESVFFGKEDRVNEYLLMDREFLDINEPNQEGNTPVILAASGHLKILQKLMERGANINERNKDGNNALMVASSLGHVDIMITLIEAGAQVDSQNEAGDTPLAHAVIHNHLKAVKELIKRKADVDMPDEDGVPLLFRHQNAVI